MTTFGGARRRVTFRLLVFFVGLLVLTLARPDLGTRVRIRYHEMRLGSRDPDEREDAVAKLLEIGRPGIDEIYPEVVATRIATIAEKKGRCRVFVGAPAPVTVALLFEAKRGAPAP